MAQPESKVFNEGVGSMAQPQSKVFTDTTFDSFPLDAKLVATLRDKMGVKVATKIQNQAIPALFDNRDLLMRAETGSGKTLAYLLPLVQSIANMGHISRSSGLYAIIMAPTRELSLQIFSVIQQVIQPFIFIVPCALTGGQKKKSEKARLRKGCNILVATPGRLVDHCKTTQALDVSHVKWLILDEADRLLDMGFERSITQIIQFLDEHKGEDTTRQNILASATLSEEVSRLASLSLKDHVYVTEEGEGNEEEIETYSIPENLTNHFVVVDTKDRLVTLTALLSQITTSGHDKAIVFLSSIASLEFHFALYQRAIKRDGNPLLSVPLFKLHGNLTQVERADGFAAFKRAAGAIIFCTDVAARGIDLPDVDWIVQYDPPGDTSDYIHRVGRTARIGNSGNACLFLLPAEVTYVTLLKDLGVQFREIRKQEINKQLVVMQGECRTRDTPDHSLQIYFEHLVLDDEELHQMAVDGYVSFIRAYAAHSADTKKIFAVRKLHVGHIAKSFALRDQPKEMAKVMKKRRSEAQEASFQPKDRRNMGDAKRLRTPVESQRGRRGGARGGGRGRGSRGSSRGRGGRAMGTLKQHQLPWRLGRGRAVGGGGERKRTAASDGGAPAGKRQRRV
eukprot:TRINITY_DN6775_c0_g1_i1.p1 TRINITY_DN6775_c0_g1~~TRINITY_DN6775_c0_g1_i1.p1  ORF type:complete len:635 (-),score=116.21 TRINITY_DN6775_c0_g1_i1:60-1925(-)